MRRRVRLVASALPATDTGSRVAVGHRWLGLLFVDRGRLDA